MTSSSSHPYLTCREFLDMAIAFERDSADFYRDLQNTTEGAARELLAVLERQEREHERVLRQFVPENPNAMIQFPPELGSGLPDAPAAGISVAELLELAIKRERHTIDAYRAAARAVGGPFHDLAEGLANFEEEHEDSLKSMRSV